MRRATGLSLLSEENGKFDPCLYLAATFADIYPLGYPSRDFKHGLVS
jgi:hypothetical protein